MDSGDRYGNECLELSCLNEGQQEADWNGVRRCRNHDLHFPRNTSLCA